MRNFKVRFFVCEVWGVEGSGIPLKWTEGGRGGCEDRVLNGPTLGEKGSKSRSWLDCIRGWWGQQGAARAHNDSLARGSRTRRGSLAREHLMVQGLGFRVLGSGIRVEVLGFRVQGLGLRVESLGFEV